jgi:hypothetical protein
MRPLEPLRSGKGIRHPCDVLAAGRRRAKFLRPISGALNSPLGSAPRPPLCFPVSHKRARQTFAHSTTVPRWPVEASSLSMRGNAFPVRPSPCSVVID